MSGYVIEFNRTLELFLEFYCERNAVDINEAIARACAILKVAEDAKDRNEVLALFKVKQGQDPIFVEQISGY